MDVEQLKAIRVQAEQRKSELMPMYEAVMQRGFPEDWQGKMDSIFGKYWWEDGEKCPFANEQELKDIHELSYVIDCLGTCNYALGAETPWERKRYIDSKPIEFKNEDIVVTDPCYISSDDDWREYGGPRINKIISHDTIYGDWSCGLYDSDTEQQIGEFCADAGMVCVASMNEVRKYNPPFEQEYVQNRPWTAAVVKNFTGTAQIQVVFVKERWTFDVRVVGKGNVNFIGVQTGF